jgi:hypothetical protein
VFCSAEASWSGHRVFPMNDSHTVCVNRSSSWNNDDPPTDFFSQHHFETLSEKSRTFSGTNNEDTLREWKGVGTSVSVW